jgi:hypothetical protein
MCIAFWLWQPAAHLPQDSGAPSAVSYALLLALNRDELLTRPSQPAHFWSDDPHIFAGRDLVQGGTWLGLSRSGRIGWLTNFRDTLVDSEAHTRGDLVTDFLQVSSAGPCACPKTRLPHTSEQMSGVRNAHCVQLDDARSSCWLIDALNSKTLLCILCI